MYSFRSDYFDSEINKRSLLTKVQIVFVSFIIQKKFLLDTLTTKYLPRFYRIDVRGVYAIR